jgi:eukaryotic-like serine/threonine-protein kinase
MSTRTSREELLFAEALARPEHERSAFLDGACHGDAALRTRILALIVAHVGTQSLLVSPMQPVIDVDAEKPGDHIGLPAVGSAKVGRYKLLQKIGEGGCGVVWMAEQEEPVRRRVALKVIKLGMDTKAVVARFEAERQALAMMDHPNIAKVHDAGATETGRPFFVMELVRGIPITKYCDENQLTPTARLELFIKVCQAIQHAHQKGIIHRDIKPSNILVTVNDGAPTPKVIDFGIAKATQGKLTDATIFTAFEQFIGTPVYMSPEQAEMSSLDIDTRSDIYSLGVLLYELLTGRPPFDPKKFAEAGVEGIRQQIREVEPPRPSARLSTLDADERTTIAKLRNTAAAQLSLILRGDLDWIVMRCIEKDRTRRYDTANGLAADIQRYLRNEPVVARPPGTAYLLQKLIRRHRVGFAAAAVIFGVVSIGAVVSSWLAIRATLAEREQTRLREDADKLRTAAETARVTESKLRTEAQAQEMAARAQEMAARRRAYGSDMNALQAALANDNLGRARELLYRHRPTDGQADLRGWEWRYLWQLCQTDAHSVLKEPDGNPIRSISLSSGGKWAAVASGGRATVFDLANRDEIRVPAGVGFVRRLAFSPTAPMLAIGVAPPAVGATPSSVRVLLWDLNSRQVVRELDAGQGTCNGIFHSGDGQTLIVSAGLESAAEVSVWRVAEGTKVASWVRGHTHTYTGRSWLAVNGRGSLAAVVTDATKLSVIDLKTGEELWNAPAAEDSITCMSFSPDDRLLATGAGYVDATIRLWDVSTGRLVGRLEGQRGWTSGLIFFADGKRLLSGSADQTLRLWDIETRTVTRTFRGHKTEVHAIRLLPDQRTVISGCKDGSVFVWDLEAERGAAASGSVPTRWGNWVFVDDGAVIVHVNHDGEVTRWSGRVFQDKRVLLEIGPLSPINRAAIRPEEAVMDTTHPLIAAVTESGKIQVWDWDRRVLVREWEAAVGNVPVTPRHFAAKGTTLIVTSPAPTGNDIAYREWDIETGREGRVITYPNPAVSFPTYIYSRDDRETIVVSFADGQGERRDLISGAAMPLKLGIPTAQIEAYSPDGKFIAVTCDLGYARILAAATLREVATLRGFRLGVHSAEFSPDMERVTVGSTASEAMTIWDAHNFERVLTLEAPALLTPIRFSPDGNLVVGGSGDSANAGTLHFWRAPSFEQIEAVEKAQAGHVRKP